MKVYSTRNLLTSKIFIIEVLKYCENNPIFIIDNAPWLIEALELLKLSYIKENFGDRSLIESAFSSFKQRTKVFFNKINSNSKNKNERFKRSIICWELFIKIFIFYYNHLRR